MVAFVADVHADVVQDGRVFEPFALAIGEAVEAPRLIEQGRPEARDLRGVLGPVVTSFRELDDASPPDVRIAVRLRDLLTMPGDVIENQPFTK